MAVKIDVLVSLGSKWLDGRTGKPKYEEPVFKQMMEAVTSAVEKALHNGCPDEGFENPMKDTLEFWLDRVKYAGIREVPNPEVPEDGPKPE